LRRRIFSRSVCSSPEQLERKRATQKHLAAWEKKWEIAVKEHLMLESLFQEIKLPQQESRVNLFSHILKICSDALFLIGFDGTVLETRDSAMRLFELAVGPKSYWDLLPDDFFGFSMKEALKFGIAHRLLYKNWMEKELEISSSFLYEGDKQGMLVVCRDITELKRLQRLVNQGDRMKELGEVAASVAHEIRNPLGGIRGFAMLLARDLALQPHLQEMAGSIIEATRSMERAVSSVLHYARPITLQCRSIEMGSYLKQIGKFLKVDPAFPPNVHLALHISNEQLIAPIDPELLKSAILNLSFNGLQAMEKGGTLSLSLLKHDLSYEIAVTDTGVGMSEEEQSRLFTPFFTTKQQGTGLGLVEVKKIVQAHNGKIEVRSRLGKGSTFTITLPLKRGAL
jgi:signal transduction histidine kinase